MRAQGLVSDGRPFTVAIKALGDNGQTTRALKLLEVGGQPVAYVLLWLLFWLFLVLFLPLRLVLVVALVLLLFSVLLFRGGHRRWEKTGRERGV